MSVEQFERFYVLEQFREFYALVLRFKQELEASAASADQGGAEGAGEGGLGDGDGGLGDLGEGEPPDPARLQTQRAEFVRSELVALMQRQAQDVLRRGDEREQRRFREVQYVMAAMADEVLLSISWPGKEYFSQHLIEEEIFRTHDAGTRFFVNLEELLRLRDPTRAEVAAAYLLALSLGFRGRYRELENQARLENYRQQLFATLFQRNPGLSDDGQLYAQAYAHTLSGKQVQWLPLLRPWLMGMGAVVLAYIVLAHIVWAHASGNVAVIVDRLTAKERGKLPPPAAPASPGAPAPAKARAFEGGGPGARPPLPPAPARAQEPEPEAPAPAEPARLAPAEQRPAGPAAPSGIRRKHRTRRHHGR